MSSLRTLPGFRALLLSLALVATLLLTAAGLTVSAARSAAPPTADIDPIGQPGSEVARWVRHAAPYRR